MTRPEGQMAPPVHGLDIARLAGALTLALLVSCVAVEEPAIGEGSHVPAGGTASEKPACAAGASESKDLTAPALVAKLEYRELAAHGPIVTRYTRDGIKIASQTFRANLGGREVVVTMMCRSSCRGPACRGMGCIPAGAGCSSYLWSNGCGGACTRELVAANAFEPSD